MYFIKMFKFVKYTGVLYSLPLLDQLLISSRCMGVNSDGGESHYVGRVGILTLENVKVGQKICFFPSTDNKS